MKKYLKQVVESLSGHKIWINHSSDLAKLSEFISSIHPRAIKTPLIRVGGKDDGGYILPDDFQDMKVCISPGVSTEISFDKAMADRKLNVFMADASVDGPPETNKYFHFEKKFLDVFEDETHMRLDTLCQMIPSELDGDRILQMDIEGAEYQVLLDMSDKTLESFRIMAIEFHSLTDLFGNFSFDIIKATFNKLMRTHYIVHIHPNNVAKPKIKNNIAIPPVMEFTFYRKDRVSLDLKARLEFPHLLDKDNVPQNTSLILPQCWYKVV